MVPYPTSPARGVLAVVVALFLLGVPGVSHAQSGDTWSAKQPPPIFVNRSSSVALNGKIYVFGGDGKGAAVYDPATDQWTMLAPMPSARSASGITVVNGLIYVLGGYDTDNLATSPSPNQVYDPSTNSWSVKASPPTARAFAAAQAVGGKIYLIGGLLGPTFLTVNEQYDPATDTWLTKAPMPTARGGMGSAVVAGKIYVIGGETNGGPLVDTNEAYDPASNTWSFQASMPTTRFEFGTAEVQGKIYAVGGATLSGYLNANEEYDPSSNTWVARAPIPVLMGGNTAAAVNGQVYSIGMNRGAQPSMVNYAYSPPSTPPSTTASSVAVVRIGTGNGTVESIPRGISCGVICSATFTSGTAIALAAAPAPGSTFAGWAGCDTVNGPVCTVLLSNVSKIVTATFTHGQQPIVAPPANAPSFQVSVTRVGAGEGTVVSSPPGISCGLPTFNPCTGNFKVGTTVTLTATAALFSNVASWTGCDTVSASASGLICTVKVKAAVTLSVLFDGGTPVNRQLQVQVTGSGTVTSTPGGIVCPFTCGATFSPNAQTITLTATPAPTSKFVGWIGCDAVSGTVCTVSLANFTKVVTATFR